MKVVITVDNKTIAVQVHSDKLLVMTIKCTNYMDNWNFRLCNRCKSSLGYLNVQYYMEKNETNLFIETVRITVKQLHETIFIKDNTTSETIVRYSCHWKSVINFKRTFQDKLHVSHDIVIFLSFFMLFNVFFQQKNN